MTEHLYYVGLGSNLGDRIGNIVQALQQLRRSTTLDAIASLYETEPFQVAGPPFMNTVVRLRSTASPATLRDDLLSMESRLGRQHSGNPHDARPIDIELLELSELDRHPYYLHPLAEIEPNLRDPASGQPIDELLHRHAEYAPIPKKRSLRFISDRQSDQPDVALAIDRVGVARMKRMLQLSIDGREREIFATIAMSADLARDRAGVHMSRFSEDLEAVTLDALATSAKPQAVEHLAAAVARSIIAAQKAESAEVHIEAPFTLERWTPISGRRGEEHYLLLTQARADAEGIRIRLGVEVEGMTACPCAQLMMREQGTRELLEAGFSGDEARRALDALPAATHNQRGRGRLLLGVRNQFSSPLLFEDLVGIVEQSMSSETYELLKRPDEFFVVNKAHHNPKFVEDVVRGMLRRTLALYPTLPDDAHIEASQINDESIHKHDAIAHAHGTFGELRAELLHGRGSKRTSTQAWLIQ